MSLVLKKLTVQFVVQVTLFKHKGYLGCTKVTINTPIVLCT